MLLQCLLVHKIGIWVCVWWVLVARCAYAICTHKMQSALGMKIEQK